MHGLAVKKRSFTCPAGGKIIIIPENGQALRVIIINNMVCICDIILYVM